jgi:hypothetical protein
VAGAPRLRSGAADALFVSPLRRRRHDEAEPVQQPVELPGTFDGEADLVSIRMQAGGRAAITKATFPAIAPYVVRLSATACKCERS